MLASMTAQEQLAVWELQSAIRDALNALSVIQNDASQGLGAIDTRSYSLVRDMWRLTIALGEVQMLQRQAKANKP